MQNQNKKPFIQNPSDAYTHQLFIKDKRIKDIFNHSDYVKKDNQTDIFAFGADDFNIQQVYQHYYTKAFLDIYFFDAMQEFAKTKEEKDKLLVKTRKVSQLAQKLFNLNMLEERLFARKHLLEAKQKFEDQRKLSMGQPTTIKQGAV